MAHASEAKQTVKPSGIHDLTPFGNPDGARANFNEITRGFVTFGSAAGWGDLSISPDDLTARVLVGRKGSGKTLYLRRLQAHAAQDPSLYAGIIQQDVPPTDDIIRFCHWFASDNLKEQWQRLWRRAIMRSLMSHIFCNPSITSNVPLEARNRLSHNFKPVGRDFNAPVSVYSQISEIINNVPTRAGTENYLRHAAWSDLEVQIAQVLVNCPPICFYIDAVDEEFEAAPMYWLQCQKGLFFAIFELLRDQMFGGRLHLFACIRNIVYSAVVLSEHLNRYKGEPHIRVLNWNRRSIEYFLLEKLSHLHPDYVLHDSSEGDPIANWLGTATIDNKRRKVRESTLTYLLRHTRLLPRDIVIMGNLLSRQMANIKKNGNPEHLQAIVRDTVAQAAKSFGHEQLMICANEVMSNQMPKHAVEHGYSNVYVKNREYAIGVKEEIEKVIRFVNTDRFSRRVLEQAKTHALENSEQMFKQIDVFSVLWRNGLIGYVSGPKNDERHIFYSDDNLDRFNLPGDRETYVFHPILIDAVNIKSSGNRPVVPFA